MSSDQITLELEPRQILGKKVKHLRAQGKTPAVIYNHGKESIIAQGDAIQMMKVLNIAGKHHPVQIKIGDKTYTTLIKEADFENKHQNLNHLVFNAVAADQKVEAEIPIHPRFNEGNDSSPAERAGLMVLNNLESVVVEAMPKNLPDIIYYDAEKLIEVGDHIRVSDLLIPEGVELKTDPNTQVASVFEPSAVAAANDAVGGEEDVTPEATSEEEVAKTESAESVKEA
jgi:large subunit ribosomal protein L25